MAGVGSDGLVVVLKAVLDLVGLGGRKVAGVRDLG